MSVRTRIREIAPGTEDFFRGVFVFTAASVDRIWGKTGNVHCMREDHLWDYIVETKRGKILNKAEVEKIAQAFQELAQREKEFTDQVNHVPGHLAEVGAAASPMPFTNGNAGVTLRPNAD